MKKFLSISLIFIIMLVIFFFSSQLGSESHLLSDKINNTTLIQLIEKLIEDSQIDHIDVSFRNIAHVLLYLALGIIVHLTMNQFLKFSKYRNSHRLNQKRRRLCTRIKLHQLRLSMISSIICFLYACSDEIHQYFVPGRKASVKDIGFDAIGFILGITLISLIFVWKNSNKKNKKMNVY